VTFEHPTIGVGSTALAATLPDTVATYEGKFLFAVFTAIFTSVLSALIGNYLRKNK
jgi:hypothetical protein